VRRDGHEVLTASDGLRGLELALKDKPDLVVLDVMIPELDGFEVCRRIRRTSSVPILMLTARTDEVDRVVGLEIGADDYVTKPFSMRELAARIKAMLRRRQLVREELSGQARASSRVVSGNLEIDPEGHHVILHGEPIPAKPKEFDLLLHFMRHRGQVLSAEQLLQDVWGYDYTGDTRTVPVHIRSLRERIELDPSSPKRIVTVRGVGYRFVG
jgi:DNA-binding response OmpR family regulator